MLESIFFEFLTNVASQPEGVKAPRKDGSFFKRGFIMEEVKFLDNALSVSLNLNLRRVRAVVSKRGVDDGNQKGGGSLQPAKENHFYYIKRLEIVKKNF